MGEVCTQANIAWELAVSTMCHLQGRVVSFIPFCRIWADLAILIGPKRQIEGTNWFRFLQDLCRFSHSDWFRRSFCRICLTGTPANPANTYESCKHTRLFVLFIGETLYRDIGAETAYTYLPQIRDHEGGQEQTICHSKVILFNYI